MEKEINITEKITDKRLENLIPWKAGDPSPNPEGRPLGQRNYATIYKEALIKLGELNGKTPDELEIELLASGFVHAKKDYRFYKDIFDRLYGTATIKVQTNETNRPVAQIIYEVIPNKIDGTKKD